MLKNVFVSLENVGSGSDAFFGPEKKQSRQVYQYT